MQTTNAKLIDAGFTVLRSGDARQPIIKKAAYASELRNISWITMEKFDTKAARDRRLKELEADPKVIIDDFSTKAPYWDEEREGVVVPLLDIVLDAKNLSKEEKTWREAMDLAADAGKRLFTRDEAYILLWQKDKINALLKEHGGDLLDTIFWTSLECSPTGAWSVNFGSGYVGVSYKYSTCMVRAVAAF